MTLSEELQWRGFINQTTLADLALLDKQKFTFYHGFDASADSQTIGNLAAMMLDRAFMRHGHKGIILAGGATSLIGDPGGKDKERPTQDEATIQRNVERARAQLEKILAGHDFTLVNNLDWTKELRLLDFLRDIGKHYSMTPLVQRDYIAQRIGEGGSGISYAEFSYTVLQGYDYLHLYDTFGCTLQLGGSDQWGNCLSGVDLIRKARGAETHVITMPLIINKATGKKFGKTEEGAVWLDPAKTSAVAFYQFWLNLDDEGIESYLKVYTELSKDVLDEVVSRHRQQPHQRIAQRTIADEVTRLVHGEPVLATIHSANRLIFGARSMEGISEAEIKVLEGELPVHVVAKNDFAGMEISEALVLLGLAGSKREARDFMNAGAISINQRPLPSDKRKLEATDLVSGICLVRRGKNKVGILRAK